MHGRVSHVPVAKGPDLTHLVGIILKKKIEHLNFYCGTVSCASYDEQSFLTTKFRLKVRNIITGAI